MANHEENSLKIPVYFFLETGEHNRFEKEVERNFHYPSCPMCLNVVKDPVQCRGNQHLFCSPCIKRHLEQYCQTCPTCREELMAETLLQPPRIAINSVVIHSQDPL